MVLRRSPPAIEHRRFPDLDAYLAPGDLLVLNDTRVLPARIDLWRPTGGRVQALMVRRVADRRWEALLDTPRRLAVGDRLKLQDRVWAAIIGKTPGGTWVLDFDADPDLATVGRAPLPPYIKRPAGPDDLERYQTVYAARDGAIAAPTAGLHFTREHLERLRAKGIVIANVTLHVGIGTFKPVKTETIEEHVLDPEWYDVPPAAAAAMAKAKRVVAVGTTCCRTIETWARTGAASGWTSLFITPGFEFKRVDALLTNFHVPKSTLVMLVAAFAGLETILDAYAIAVKERYRFFSYGDAMLIV
jgi:S-adenosylmethionine:tRNA ribosyltransferase-isomerase